MNKDKDSIGKIKSKIDLDNGWWYCAKDIGRTLAKTILRSSHRAIIDLILDKTFGWRDPKSKELEERKKRKVWAYITGKDFKEYTGLEEAHLSKSIKKLVKWNIIKRKIEGWKKQYSFNVNVSEWDKKVFRVKYQKLLVSNGKQYYLSETESNTCIKRKVNLSETESNNRCDTIKDNTLPDAKKTLIKELYIKEEEKDHIDSLEGKEKKVVKEERTEREEVFDYWNNYGINPITLITPYIRDIDEALKTYTKEDIQLAISNYIFILKGEDYFFDHKFTLDTFLKAKHIEKFLKLENAKDNYKTKTVNENREGEEIPLYRDREENKDFLDRKNYCEYYRGVCLKDRNLCKNCDYKDKNKRK